jgi:RNA recognition motif-containing protein
MESRTMGEGTTTVYIGNLPWKCSSSELVKAFKGFGTIRRVNIPATPDGRTKGYGFIEFSSLEESIQAIAKGHQCIEVGGRVVEVLPANK